MGKAFGLRPSDLILTDEERAERSQRQLLLFDNACLEAWEKFEGEKKKEARENARMEQKMGVQRDTNIDNFFAAVREIGARKRDAPPPTPK